MQKKFQNNNLNYQELFNLYNYLVTKNLKLFSFKESNSKINLLKT